MVSLIKKLFGIIFYIPNLIFSIIGKIFNGIFFAIGEFFKGLGYLIGLIFMTAIHSIWAVSIFMLLFSFIDMPILGAIIGVLLAFKFAFEAMNEETTTNEQEYQEEGVPVTLASIKEAWNMGQEQKKTERDEETRKQAEALRKNLGL